MQNTAYVRLLADEATVLHSQQSCMYSNFVLVSVCPLFTAAIKKGIFRCILQVSLTCKDRRLHPDLLLSRGPGRPGAHLWQHGLVVLSFSGLLHIRVHTIDIPLLACHPGRPVHLWRSPGSAATPHHCIHTQFRTLSAALYPLSHTISSFTPGLTHSQLH